MKTFVASILITLSIPSLAMDTESIREDVAELRRGTPGNPVSALPVEETPGSNAIINDQLRRDVAVAKPKERTDVRTDELLEGILDTVPDLKGDCKELNDITCGPAVGAGIGNYDFFENFVSGWQTELNPDFSLATMGVSPEPPRWHANFQIETPLTKEDSCACLKSHFTGKPIEDEKKEEERRLKAKVRELANKKILNDYTTHFEDVRFYAANAATIFHRNENKRGGRVRKVQCSNPDPFFDAMKNNASCKAKRLSKEDQEIRMSEVLKSFDSNLSNDFDSSIRTIQRQIFTTTADPSLLSDWRARRAHDEGRYVLVKTSNDVQATDRIITKLMGNAEFKTSLTAKGLNSGNAPKETILEILSEKFKSNTLKALLDKDTLGSELSDQLEKSIAANQPESFLNVLHRSFSIASEIHPGIDRILKNQKLFTDVSAKLKSPANVVGLIESDDLMNDHFEESCKEVVENLAEVACSSDDELMSKVSESEIIANTKSERPNNTQIQTLLLCDRVLSPNATAVKGGMLLDPESDKLSDYIKMVTKKPSTIAALIGEARSRPDSDFARAFNDARQSAPAGVSIPSDANDKVATDIFGKDVTSRPAIENSVAADVKVNNTKVQSSDKSQVSDASNPVISDSRPDAAIVDANYSNSSNVVAGSNNALPQKIETPREMREFLSEGTSKEVVANVVNDSSDDMMKDLIRLKEETEKSRLKILELSSENEKLKLKTAEETLAQLQKDRAALEPGQPEVKSPDVTQRDRTLQPSTVRDNKREIASVDQQESGGASAGTNSQTAAVSGSAQASLGGLNRALLATSGNIANSVDYSDPVVVSSATTRSGILEIRSQDVGLDLLNYITSNDADIQTLIKLKTSGIMYKYKIVENGQLVEKEMLIDYQNLNEDVKKLIDKKIAQNKNLTKEKARLDKEILDLKRVYSYSTLKIILGEQMKKK